MWEQENYQAAFYFLTEGKLPDFDLYSVPEFTMGIAQISMDFVGRETDALDICEVISNRRLGGIKNDES